MALSVADQGYVLHAGRIVLHDTAEALERNEMVRQAYLARSRPAPARCDPVRRYTGGPHAAVYPDMGNIFLDFWAKVR